RKGLKRHFLRPKIGVTGFALGNVSVEFCTRGSFRQNSRINPAEFRTRGRFRGNCRINHAEFPRNLALKTKNDPI
ncbi:MAG: hypothetical protein Q8881_03830, partial [Sweet potato little leaf phytoplasma]|nr:hypothetical protein [Sweet potato little leaf phytoplasma]